MTQDMTTHELAELAKRVSRRRSERATAPATSPPGTVAARAAHVRRVFGVSSVALDAAATFGARVRKVTGTTTDAEALETIARWKAAAQIPEVTAVAALGTWKASAISTAADRARDERNERDHLVVALVTSKHESPATAWANPKNAPDVEKREPAKHLAEMPLEQLRARAHALCGPEAVASFKTFKADPSVSGGGEELSALELERCASKGIKPEYMRRAKAAISAGIAT